MFVNITGNVNAGQINTAVEVLRNTSSLVNKSALGTVYKNMNIWVGTTGFAVPKNINQALIKFRVENAWLETNNIAQADVVLFQWYDDDWNKLETGSTGRNGSFTVFEAKTNRFSPFAISATEPAQLVTNSAIDKEKADSSVSNATERPPESTKRKWMPGFTAIATLLVFAIISVRAGKRK